MKNYILPLAAAAFWALPMAAQSKSGDEVKVAIDLNVVKDDKLMVTVNAPAMKSDKVTYHIPKIIPGTYSEDDYGKFVEDFKAFDKKNKPLNVVKADDNSWTISNGKKLDHITYWVNDTYDVENTHDIFSPAGTNILADTNFMLNMHGFVGYFDDKLATPYVVTVTHPASLFGATSLVDADNSDTKDVFRSERYFEVVDNPIMYSKPDYTTFNVGGMEILISVYSPNGTFDAKTITPDMEKMMRAQKKFLGDINKNKKYTVLLYLSDMKKPDAHGFGALEHHTSTTVLFPEMMPKDQLVQGLIDVISHEFFHTVTPLSVHSKEIHYFDYNSPKMSKHLWMYEGVTEYFANLFQVNQGLITEEEFYNRMAGKIENASHMNDKMPFTEMSANVLKEPYKSQYLNVYEKGALIGMCIDITIREKSNGQRGILDMMKRLSAIYGPTKPFDDNELFERIVLETYPEVGEFLNQYVAGDSPIPYDAFFAKVGVSKTTKKVPANVFMKGHSPFVTIKPETKEIAVIASGELNPFMKEMKLQPGDIITSVDGKDYNLDNIYDLIMGSQKWKEGDEVAMKIKRDGKEMLLKGKVKFEYEDHEGYMATDDSKKALREAWLKG